MPTVDVGFLDPDGKPSHQSLLQYGPSIKVHVAPYPDLNRADAGSELVSQLTLALIDTGARESCIDTQLATHLGLAAIDTMLLSGVGGSRPHPVFLAYVAIPELGIAQYGKFAGVELSDGGQVHGVLLGRTFLGATKLVYDGPSSHVTVTLE